MSDHADTLEGFEDFPFDQLLFNQTFWLVGDTEKTKHMALNIQKHGGIISSSINVATRVIFLQPEDFTHMVRGLNELKVMLSAHQLYGKGIPLAEGWVHDSITSERPIETKPYLITDKNLFDEKFWQKIGLGGGRAFKMKMKKRKNGERDRNVQFAEPSSLSTPDTATTSSGADVQSAIAQSVQNNLSRPLVENTSPQTRGSLGISNGDSPDRFPPAPPTPPLRTLSDANIDPALLDRTPFPHSSIVDRRQTRSLTSADKTPMLSVSGDTHRSVPTRAVLSHIDVNCPTVRDLVDHVSAHCPQGQTREADTMDPNGILSTNAQAIQRNKRTREDDEEYREEGNSEKKVLSPSKSAIYNRRYRNQTAVQPQDRQAYEALVSHLKKMVAGGGFPKGGMKAYLIGKGIHSLYSKYGSLIREAVPGLPGSRDHLTKMAQVINPKWQKFVDEETSEMATDVGSGTV
ncbi:uncharacterized protein I303_107526 [Kwoniella dejecticola CBS 10117]|uniref:BRCT domain-containing protein n=1 Tax=Kwoniella dejecticola CBS 10117 TaxID=1296121 RepID=A0A1A5ZZY3_9TREE|nr:uncharacterized protein I303_06931 [Kwoniella dejecticola CBS 10117]OBR83366.1 hypothetical protein I303_06931 [Kwoniella dejecticola CBS 10117]